MNSWFANTGTAALATIPAVDVEATGSTTGLAGKQRILRGYCFTLSASCASSGLAIGSCLIQYGPSTGNLASTVVVGYGSSIGPSVIKGNCYIQAGAFRGTLGTGSSVCAPVTISLWGDYA